MNKPREYPVTNGDLHIHAVAEGPRGATPLVLVHGYPDNHRVWDRVAADLSRDFLVIRYDVRGAGRSGKPGRTREYRLALLAQDLRAVVDTLIPGRPFHLVAHDWGAIQSWESATAPELASRLRSYTAISGPCLDHVGYWLRERLGGAPGQGGTAQLLRQLGRSWYVLLFQLPLLPELIWLAGLDRLWPAYLRRHEGIADAHYRTSQKADGRFGVKLYRANVLPRLLRPRPRRANCPVQVIVPTQDAYVSPPLTDSLVRWTGKLTRQELDAPHWAPLTHPEAVCRSVRAFVAAHP